MPEGIFNIIFIVFLALLAIALVEGWKHFKRSIICMRKKRIRSGKFKASDFYQFPKRSIEFRLQHQKDFIERQLHLEKLSLDIINETTTRKTMGDILKGFQFFMDEFNAEFVLLGKPITPNRIIEMWMMVKEFNRLLNNTKRISLEIYYSVEKMDETDIPDLEKIIKAWATSMMKIYDFHSWEKTRISKKERLRFEIEIGKLFDKDAGEFDEIPEWKRAGFKDEKEWSLFIKENC